MIEDIAFFADTMNGLPRNILGCKTPEALFERELKYPAQEQN